MDKQEHGKNLMSGAAESAPAVCPLKQEAQIFRDVLQTYLLPLFYSASIEGPWESRRKPENGIDEMRSNAVNLRVPGHPELVYALQRNEAFTVPERALLQDIMEKIYEGGFREGKWRHIALCDVIERAIARQLSPDCSGTILQILQVYSQWAAETYEGRRITHTVGLCCKTSAAARRNFYELRNFSALKVLGSTPDTILTLDGEGSVTGIETISMKQNNYLKNKNVLAPIRMAPLALWTNSARKIAFKLCRNGEILIFQNKQLVYAKRRSHWRRFPSKSILCEHFFDPHSTDVEKAKHALYLTALDLAFSGKGGCLGFLQTADPLAAARRLVNEEMLFLSANPARAIRLLSVIVDSAKFQNIPRLVRLSFCSLDGATLLDPQGNILTIGAILRTQGNPSQGGGRTAAAQTLGDYGAGVKISDDGFIEIHRRDAPPLFLA